MADSTLLSHNSPGSTTAEWYFVLMPFGYSFDSYYQKIIKPAAADVGMATLRSDEIYGRKAIIKDIWVKGGIARHVAVGKTRSSLERALATIKQKLETTPE